MKLQLLRFLPVLGMSLLLFQTSSAQWVDESFDATSGLNTKNVRGVDFADVDHGVLVLEDANGKFAVTTNGGNDWTVMQTSQAISLMKVANPSVDTMYMIGKDGNGDHVILATYDGGANFQTPYISSDSLTDIVFMTNAIGVAVGGNGSVLGTVNSGATWTQLTSDLAGKLVTGVSFPSLSTGYCVTFDGELFQTTNNGANWIQLTINSQPGFTHAVHFPDLDHGYVVGGLTVNYTSNAANTWQDSFLAQGHLQDVHFWNSTSGYAVGLNGSYITTNDGFQTDQRKGQVGAAGTNNLYAVHMTGPTHGIKGGANGGVYRFLLASLSGTVLDENLQPVAIGNVYLYRAELVQGTFPLVDQFTLGAGGTYSFADVPGGSLYLLKVAGQQDSLYYVTYYPSELYWQTAGQFAVNDNVTGKDIEMISVVPVLTGGSGIVAGVLIEADSTNKRGPGDPLKDQSVTLMDMGDTTVAGINKTDVNGEFSFNGLPTGNYQLVYDVAGVPINNQNISITPGDTIRNGILIELDTAENVITVTVPSTSGILNLAVSGDMIKLFPNPASTEVYMALGDLKQTNEQLLVTIYDVTGKAVLQQSFTNRGNESRISVDVSSILPGMYILELNNGGQEKVTSKLLITK